MEDQEKQMYEPSLVYGSQPPESSPEPEIMKVIEKSTGHIIAIKAFRFNPEYHSRIEEAQFRQENLIEAPVEVPVEPIIPITQDLRENTTEELRAGTTGTGLKVVGDALTTGTTFSTITEDLNNSDPVPITEEAEMPTNDYDKELEKDVIDDYSKMKMPTLRSECKKRGVPFARTTTKVELIKLLKEC